MLAATETSRIEDAGRQMLPIILQGANWVQHANNRETAVYLRRVGSISVSASIDVTPLLDVYLRVAFRAPGLTPMQAVNLLEAFLKSHLPLLPQTEWLVEIDGQSWIHFSRRWVQETLEA